MSVQVNTSAPFGFYGISIDVECDINKGLPGITMVGLGNKSIDEAKERIKSALLNSGLTFPRKRITINLAPADISKDGTSYDLPMVVAILAASKQIQTKSIEKSSFVGELALDGRIRPIRAIITHVNTAKNSKLSRIYVPEENAAQASLVSGIEIIPVKSLAQLYKDLRGQMKIQPVKPGASPIANSSSFNHEEVNLDDISGQETAKRALEIAAAGHHNLIMSGPPGTGKSMLAKAIISILPPLTIDEMVEITNLYSLANIEHENIINKRPFRSPHHTSSHIALVGGGHNATPGEISLAHKGVLFLDELPEYSRQTLESLRQPMEDCKIDISRANMRISYPSDFMLVATQNPCPCGYFGDPKHRCNCTPYQISRYQKKVSGPLLDRIDISLQIDRIENSELLDHQPATANKETTQTKQRVYKAREKQLNRQGKLNSSLSNRELKQIEFSAKAKTLLVNAAEKLSLSARSYIRTLRVARTIADLEDSKIITENHISESLMYRIRNQTDF